MSELPDRPANNEYIDRVDYQRAVLTVLESGDAKHVVLGDTHAIYGSGKTTALARLYYELKDQGQRTPIWLALMNYSILNNNESIGKVVDSLDALKQNLYDYKRLLIDLGRAIDAPAFGPFSGQLVEILDQDFESLFKIDIDAKGGKSRAGALARVFESESKGGNVDIDINIASQDKILEVILESKRQKIAQAFLDIFAPISRQRKFVVFADDFCWIIGQRIGDWLLQLIEAMPNTVALINSTWQANMIEWLYHLNRVNDRPAARLQLIRLFLEAFDWWGSYLSSGFCSDLLAIWEETQPDDDQGVVVLLQSFLNAYPPGYDKHGRGCWDEVFEALTALRAATEQMPRSRMLESDWRMVQGHIDRYTAEAYRFYDPSDYAMAEASYESALENFEPAWNRMWIKSYMADLYLDWARELGRDGEGSAAAEKYALAEDHARQSIEMALQEKNLMMQDHEVTNLDYRVIGDCMLDQGRLGEAMQAYGRATVHAYIFHFMESNQDAYSRQLYCDTGQHIARATLGLAAGGKAGAAQAACRYLRDLWRTNTRFGLAAKILAELPPDFDLNAALVAGDEDCLRQYIMPGIPIVGERGAALTTEIAVSRQIGGIVEDDRKVPPAALGPE